MGMRGKIQFKRGILAVMLCLSMLVVSWPLVAIPASVEAASGGETSMAFVIGRNTYTVNGVTITMDVSPTVIEDRTMLPVRFVAEPLGASVNWDEATSKVTVQLMDTKIELWIGQSNALVNGATTPIDPDNPNVKPLTLNDRTMLPVRFVSENLGCNVGWDEATQQVTVVRYAGGGASTTPGSDLTGTPDPNAAPTATPAPAPTPGATPPSPGGGEDESEGENGDSLDEDFAHNLDANAMVEKVPRLFDSVPKVTGITTAIKPGTITSRATDSNTILRAPGSTGAIKTMTLSDLEGIKTLKDIGRGYDVFGRYASNLSLKNAVLDIDGPNGLIAKGQVEEGKLPIGNFREIEGESLEEYAKDMTTTVNISGGFLGFKASVETSFSSSYRSKSSSYYDTINYLVMEDSLYIEGSCNYKDYLLPDVKAILNTGKYNGRTFTNEEIFDIYGGYVLVDGIFGGRLEFNVTADSEFCGGYSNFKANVSASYNAGIGSVTEEYGSETAENREDFLRNSSTTVITYGGTAQDGRTLTGGQQNPSVLQAWRDSVPSRSVLVDFGEVGQDALIPIWTLCEDQGRGVELAFAFREYAKANGRTIILPPPQKYIEGIMFVWGDTREKALAKLDMMPAGIMPTYVDLNDGAHGLLGHPYIYLVYKLTEDYRYALGDFFMEYSPRIKLDAQTIDRSHNGNTGQYHRYSTDLNMRRESENPQFYNHIYLNSAKYALMSKKAEDVKPITQIEVVTSPPDKSDGWKYVKWQNTNEAADCNREDFGHSVYIRYK